MPLSQYDWLVVVAHGNAVMRRIFPLSRVSRLQAYRASAIIAAHGITRF